MENPFYAGRKPQRQVYSGLRKFIDVLSLSMGVALEGNALRDWLIERGFNAVGFTGVSLGGHTAALAASCCLDRVPCVPAYCWSSSAGVWTRGALSKRVDFSRLGADYRSDPGYRQFREESGESGISHWSEMPDFPHPSVSSSPEVAQMYHPAGTVNREALNYTVFLAHYFSHLGNYRRPVDPSLVEFITGTEDLFYGAENLTDVGLVWPGVKTTRLNVGHVDGFIREGREYRKLIAKSIQRCASLETEPGAIDKLVKGVHVEKEQHPDGLDLIQKAFQAATIRVVKTLEK